MKDSGRINRRNSRHPILCRTKDFQISSKLRFAFPVEGNEREVFPLRTRAGEKQQWELNL
jgi:hypothetical protein